MIIVTGGAGFIGSAITAALNKRSIRDILIVDELLCDEKWKNLRNLSFSDYIEKNDFLKAVLDKKISDKKVETVFHLAPAQALPRQTLHI